MGNTVQASLNAFASASTEEPTRCQPWIHLNRTVLRLSLERGCQDGADRLTKTLEGWGEASRWEGNQDTGLCLDGFPGLTPALNLGLGGWPGRSTEDELRLKGFGVRCVCFGRCAKEATDRFLAHKGEGRTDCRKGWGGEA